MKDKKQVWGALPLPLFLTAVGLFVIYEMQFKKVPDSEAAYPTLAAIILLLSSIPLYIQSFKGTMNRDAIRLYPFLRVMLLAAILLFYVYMLKKVGYLICTFVLCNIVLMLFGYEKKLFGVIYSLILSFSVYGIFKLLLGVPLAAGIFGLR